MVGSAQCSNTPHNSFSSCTTDFAHGFDQSILINTIKAHYLSLTSVTFWRLYLSSINLCVTLPHSPKMAANAEV